MVDRDVVPKVIAPYSATTEPVQEPAVVGGVHLQLRRAGVDHEQRASKVIERKTMESLLLGAMVHRYD